MRVLVPNLGSTSLKYQLIEMADEEVLAKGRIERIGDVQSPVTTWDGTGKATETAACIPDHRAAIEFLIERLSQLEQGCQPAKGIEAVGFKAVHGGPRYQGSFRVTEALLEAMEEYKPAVPLHNSVYIHAMRTFREVLPSVPLVAVFETGFHATMPEPARVYGVPYEWTEKHGVRRYGFHGASHRYVSQRVPEILQRPPLGLRLVSCHLGGSSSVCAVRDGKSVDTTFGFSGQSGLEHGSRCGDLDAFAVLYLMERENLTRGEIAELLCKKAGLLAISGVSNDLRDLEAAAARGHDRARLAVQVFVYGVKKFIGAYAAAMGGLNAVAFAGGIGENSYLVRQEVCRGLEFLGIYLDEERNRAPLTSDRIISESDSTVVVLVVRTNEEIIVARETVCTLTSEGGLASGDISSRL
jgi:acetate kinase